MTEWQEHARRQARTRSVALLPMRPTDWLGGVPPEVDWLPVDFEIARIANRSRNPRVRTDDEIRQAYPDLGWLGRHLHLRLALWCYSVFGMADDRAQVLAEIDRLAEQIWNIQDLKDVAMRVLNCATEEERFRYVDPLFDLCDVLDELDPYQEECLELWNTLARPQGGRPADFLRTGFVEALKPFWELVTGSPLPRNADGPFASLVAAAWDSLGAHMPEISWDSALRRHDSSATPLDAIERSKEQLRYAYTRLWVPAT
jgi:hypothetical protein